MALPEKILTRVKSARTQQEYYVGTTGAYEHVHLELSAPSEVDWTQYNVQVQNLSKETSAEYPIDANGVCEFAIPMGDNYEVLLPIVDGYIQPHDIGLVATLATRTIEYRYTVDDRKELLAITAHVTSINGETVSILEGLPIVATDTLGDTYTGYFDANGKCNTIEIPYGRVYDLAFPTVGGYIHDHNGEHHTAGLPSREIDIHYTQIGIGVFGIDANGNYYPVAQISELADKSIIVAGGYNDATLAASPRGDGSYGNGFCWKIGEGSIGSLKWAGSNVEFDTTRLPFYENLGTMKFAGRHMTNMIIEIGLELGVTTPAATNCNSRHLTIKNVDRNGFLPAFDQIYRIANTNKTAFQALYTALGLTAPSIWNSYWWTACQNNAVNSIVILNGNKTEIQKYAGNDVFVCYDL